MDPYYQTVLNWALTWAGARLNEVWSLLNLSYVALCMAIGYMFFERPGFLVLIRWRWMKTVIMFLVVAAIGVYFVMVRHQDVVIIGINFCLVQALHHSRKGVWIWMKKNISIFGGK